MLVHRWGLACAGHARGLLSSSRGIWPEWMAVDPPGAFSEGRPGAGVLQSACDCRRALRRGGDCNQMPPMRLHSPSLLSKKWLEGASFQTPTWRADQGVAYWLRRLRQNPLQTCCKLERGVIASLLCTPLLHLWSAQQVCSTCCACNRHRCLRSMGTSPDADCLHRLCYSCAAASLLLCLSVS